MKSSITNVLQPNRPEGAKAFAGGKTGPSDYSPSPDQDRIMACMTPLPPPLDRELLRRTITQHLTQDEHELFCRACERSGLDPFGRHVYPVKREQFNPETRRKESTFAAEATIDGLRLSAERTAKYRGQIGPFWCGPDGQFLEIWTSPEPPTACKVGILREDFQEPVWGKALYQEFVQTYPDGEPTPFWLKMAANQLAKCAEALGFRKAFPREFSGLYTHDEMGQSEVIEMPKRETDQSIPVPLRQFVNRGTGDRRNVAAAFQFLQDQFIQAFGAAGQEMFSKRHLQLPRVFKTREECQMATIQCWLDMWQQIQSAGERAA